jgi:hypothetical protein
MTTVSTQEPHLHTTTAVRFIRITGWILALAIGALQTWAGRFGIGEDGLSYVDIADAYLRGDWQHTVNAYWSPMYSWLIAIVLGVTRPSPFLESTVVHIGNFLIYVAALAAFEFLLRSLLRVHRQRTIEAAADGAVRCPDAVLCAFGYGLFMWVSLEWITVPLETPDMCLTIFVYLAAGLLLRIRQRPAATTLFVALGCVLGLAYLTKSAMFPLSAVFLALGRIVSGRTAGAWRRTAVAAVMFALVAVPYAGVLSTNKHRLTFGDTGKLAYVWFANGATDRELHWSYEFPDDRRPVHPSRKVFDRPAIYEFGSDPVGGTYPVWYDPSYWHEGETPHFDLRGQLRVLHWSGEDIWHMLVDDADFLVVASLILLATAMTSWRILRREAVDHVELFLPAIAAGGMYALVLFSPRYIAVFLLLFWLGVFASVRLPAGAATRRLFQATAAGVLIMIALRLAPLTLGMIQEIRGQRSPGAHRSFDIAQGLKQLGAQPGDAVARIGYGPPAYWARLAGVRIVAEMFSEEPDFPSVPDVDQALESGVLKPEVVQAFARTGAKFIIAWKPPADVARQGWTELGDHTQWFAYPVPR